MLGDRLARKPHLTSFLQSLRQENNELSKEREVTFAVCTDTNEVAVTRVLARRSRIVMVIDPALNALGNTEAQRALQERSRGSGHRRRAGPGGQRRFLRSPDSGLRPIGVGVGSGLGGCEPGSARQAAAIDSEQKARPDEGSDNFTAGLLHDMGKVTMLMS